MIDSPHARFVHFPPRGRSASFGRPGGRWRLHLACIAITFAALTPGCAVPPAAPGLIEITERPAERALLAGMRAYDDAQYPQAEQLLQQALKIGLASPRDQAAAHKYLAFIDCTSARIDACEAEFRAARKADPKFTLSNAESGHPLWGPVYQRVQQ